MSETVTGPDILEDLKSGRLVVVPREALADLCNAVMADISEAKRRLDADIPKDAPVHPVSAFLTGTALHIGKARASPDHTAGLVALVEGMERERDETAKQLSDPLAVHINMMRGTIAKPSIENIRHIYPEIAQGEFEARCALRSAEARALAAEAELVRLKARIADLEERHYAD